jgi:RNA polymerase sigma-70 factor (ECF subfamily)
MNISTATHLEVSLESDVIEGFLKSRDEVSFADLFRLYTPRLLAFYRVHGCEPGLAEDLTQEVMLTVHRKASQIRDHTLFRAWIFRIARNALFRDHYNRKRQVPIIDIKRGVERAVTSVGAAGVPAFEFQQWMAFLDTGERELMTLRFIEGWERQEIASAKRIPVGTIQWRVFKAKKKLAPHLASVKPKGRARDRVGGQAVSRGTQ